jgi:hypothetical protein
MKSLNCTKFGYSVWFLSGLILIGFWGRTGISKAAEDTWTFKTPMPTGRGFLSGTVLDGKIYVVGGTDNTQLNAIALVEVYDPVSDTWTTRASMPEARTCPATCTYNGKVYVFGGASPMVYSPPKNTVFEYDPQTDTWTQKANMPHAFHACGVAVLNDTIYLMGGGGVYFPPDSTVMAYHPLTESWIEREPMPTARGSLSACVVDGQIYAIGGTTEDYHSVSYKLVEVFDPATNTWTQKADMATGRFGLGTCVLDGKIYAVGGWWGSDVLTINEMYDPATNVWESKSGLQQKRFKHFLCSVGVKIYSIGGAYPQGSQAILLSSVEEYDTGLGIRSPDFNGDGKVDIEDLIILIEYWGTDESLCDIAPEPFGDGIVDVLDLELLMSYWGQEIDDTTLIAHWALDETQGIIAYDSAGENDGTLYGEPLWQPDGGKIDGALQLDGIDDYISTDFVLNPADGPFSVFAWIKGGEPGQVVLSQTGGANWLSANPSEGKLMTEIVPPTTRSPLPPLVSETRITNGNWHHIGFVWDGMHRTLYVDGVVAAEDTQNNLAGSSNGLYIGAGKNLDAGTFWSGLIDDVRIYNKALNADEIAALPQ